MQTMNIDQLRATAAAGGVTGATLKADGSVFFLSIETRNGGSAVVVTSRGRDGHPPQPRKFIDPRKAMMLLRELGIQQLQIDGSEWRPDEGSLDRSRPDRADAMKATHSARAHDQWFRSHVEAGNLEADDPHTQWVAHDDAKASWAVKRDTLSQKANDKEFA